MLETSCSYLELKFKCSVQGSMVVEHLFMEAMKEWMLANGTGHNFLNDVDALHSQHSGNPCPGCTVCVLIFSCVSPGH